MDEIIIPVFVCAILFLGLPWIVFHYVTKWKQAGTITREDENLLDDLYRTARMLEDRLMTVERIIAADNPDYRPLSAQRPEPGQYDPSRRN
ncbi:envelope stress response membrane protein PspB [Sphingomonas sp. ABOLD]|uniref:Phage shock protein B n=1 Tax=Sphingomonas trueperi TaxID=53317 RepID=A0A7X6BC92_9SPHN|nr:MULTISPECIES: envelope stress response membrane protein PspB [unclassified Sphingomonas]NJB97864.1 phage shock protein B [Sphingomonas trueperi]RSV40565.1 envelope stress response membrane protein PspB [Sphingomonas sp. ABOLD]RSV41465.1 envelope stress response membrane protein PspB [Sphingomonas sp. ABOLE]